MSTEQGASIAPARPWRERARQKEPIDVKAIRYLYPEVGEFAEIMLRQLARHAHKGNQKAWRHERLNDLLLAAYREFYELQETLRHGPANEAEAVEWWEQVKEDAADIANFAMMIADNVTILTMKPRARS